MVNEEVKKYDYLCSIIAKNDIITNMGTINFTQILSATLVLLSIIDIVGSIPIILQLREKGRHVDATKATLTAWFMKPMLLIIPLLRMLRFEERTSYDASN